MPYQLVNSCSNKHCVFFIQKNFEVSFRGKDGKKSRNDAWAPCELCLTNVVEA